MARKIYASIDVEPPGPTPTLMQEMERNWSLVGTGYFAAMIARKDGLHSLVDECFNSKIHRQML